MDGCYCGQFDCAYYESDDPFCDFCELNVPIFVDLSKKR